MQHTHPFFSMLIFLILSFSHTTNTAGTDMASCDIENIDPNFLQLIEYEISSSEPHYPNICTTLFDLRNYDQIRSLYVNSHVTNNYTRKPISIFFLEKAFQGLQNHAQKSREECRPSEAQKMCDHISFITKCILDTDTHDSPSMLNVTPELHSDMQDLVKKAKEFRVKSFLPSKKNTQIIQSMYNDTIDTMELTIEHVYWPQDK